MPLVPVVGRAQPRVRVALLALGAFLTLGVVLHLVPFYFMVVTSLKAGRELFAEPPTPWPRHVDFSAWRLVASMAGVDALFGDAPGSTGLWEHPFGVYLRNSLLMTVGTLLVSLPVTSLAAYATSKLHARSSARRLFAFFVGTLLVPGAVTLIPAFLLTRNFPFALPVAPLVPGSTASFPVWRLWDTPLAIVVPGAYNAFNFLVFKGYFDTIPDSVIHAARVDGGTEFNVFRRIVVPMSVPAFAVAAWTQFSSVWDAFLWPSLVLQSGERIPTSVAVYSLVERLAAGGATDASAALAESESMRAILGAGLSWNAVMVLSLLQTLPVFVMFLVCRESLLKGYRLRGFR